uniref:Uncharacterized protein n=1 Tax=Arundo donax TaxID=35708 RepID=A0A0A9BA08_ARUDO
MLWAKLMCCVSRFRTQIAVYVYFLGQHRNGN